MWKIILGVLLTMVLIIAIAVTSGGGVMEQGLKWSAVGDDGLIGEADYYAIAWTIDSTSLVSDFEGNVHANKATTGPAGTPESFTVTGLESNTTYFYAVKTVDHAGNWSEISNILKATTPDEVPPAAITDLGIE